LFVVSANTNNNAPLPFEAEATKVVKDLTEEVAASTLLHHPFLQCYSTGGYTDMNVATYEFALNHYAYSRNFLKYLQNVKDKVAQASPDDVHLLSENMDEEMGNYEDSDLETLEAHGVRRELVNKKPHTQLIRHFLDTVGVTQKDFERTDTIGAVFTRDILKMYDDANACEALAIIGFAIEQTVATLYQFIWSGLKSHTTMNPDDFVFFPLHILVDDGHADHIKNAFHALYARNPEQCANAPAVVRTVLTRRSKMLADLKAHVESVTGGQVCTGN
jgi:pyrroloquinoline quinone (PQQ) biosynthesis protein C